MRLTRAKAIRAKCLDCMCNQRAEVRACTTKTCPLWIYRMGYEINPETGGKIPRKKKEDEE